MGSSESSEASKILHQLLDNKKLKEAQEFLIQGKLSPSSSSSLPTPIDPNIDGRKADINDSFEGSSILSTFLESTRGEDAELLEAILFPPPPSAAVESAAPPQAENTTTNDNKNDLIRPHCNIFDFKSRLGVQEHYKIKGEPPQDLAFILVFWFTNDTRDGTYVKSIVPYLKLIFEAADILPSPTKRNDPSLWKKYGKKWNNDKEFFVWNEYVLHCAYRREDDVELFKFFFANGLIQNQDHLARLVHELTESHKDTTPIIREMVTGGHFPSNLKNSSFSYFAQPTPLSSAVLHGKVELVKILVENQIGGTLDIIDNKNGGAILDMGDLVFDMRKVRGMSLIHIVAHSADSAGEEILPILLTMPGSDAFINAVAPIQDTSGSDMYKNITEATPAMLAARHSDLDDPVVKTLLEKGGDQLPESLKGKYSSFQEWFDEFKQKQRKAADEAEAQHKAAVLAMMTKIHDALENNK